MIKNAAACVVHNGIMSLCIRGEHLENTVTAIDALEKQSVQQLPTNHLRRS